MANANSTNGDRIPKVRIARPKNRPIQLRYKCPVEQREIRISTNTYDEAEAEQQKAKLEAKLLLGLEAKPKRKVTGPRMPWEIFREEYTRLKVATFRSENAMTAAEVRLDVCESIVKPRTLQDMAKPETLAMLQAELLAGVNSKKKRRSAHTVRSYMMGLKAALNWAHRPMRWLPAPCEFDMIEADKDETLKGRPLTLEEFERLLVACDAVCQLDPEGWRFLLRGLWESGLRLGEAMKVSWDDEAFIVPLRTRKRGYLLRIPGHLQKNHKTQEVPTTPLFGLLLDEIPEEQRTGWIFNPKPLRSDWNRRISVGQAGRIISDIGEKAGVVVSEGGKFASAHDLRRSFGQRMADAGLPPRDLQAIMRHSSITTTERYYLRHRAVDQAERIAKYLDCTHFSMGTPTEPDAQKETPEEAVTPSGV